MLNINLDKVIGIVINSRWASQIAFPHRDFLDLVVAYRIPVLLHGDSVTYRLVTDDLLEGSGITEEMLYEAAVKNYRGQIHTMTAMFQLLGHDMAPLPYASNMYVLTNPGVQFGAFGITQIAILDDHAKWMHSDLAIIPSSVHELIIFPFNKDIASWIVEYVPSVNQEQVDPVDVLSDNMYVYRRDSRAVEIWKEKFA